VPTTTFARRPERCLAGCKAMLLVITRWVGKMTDEMKEKPRRVPSAPLGSSRPSSTSIVRSAADASASPGPFGGHVAALDHLRRPEQRTPTLRRPASLWPDALTSARRPSAESSSRPPRPGARPRRPARPGSQPPSAVAARAAVVVLEHPDSTACSIAARLLPSFPRPPLPPPHSGWRMSGSRPRGRC